MTTTLVRNTSNLKRNTAFQSQVLNPTTGFAKQNRWGGRELIKSSATLADIGDKLPVFSRRPMALSLLDVDEQANSDNPQVLINPYSDIITIENDGKVLPVWQVSKTYKLVQHTDVWATMVKAVETIGLDPNDLETDMLLCEYGERMCLTMTIPNYDFDPGDGHNISLRVSVMNSIDTSTATGLSMEWFRLICTNGMVYGLANRGFRRTHTANLSLESMITTMQNSLTSFPDEEQVMRRWLETPVQPKRLDKWIDRVVSEKWDRGSAIRLHHILKYGWDGKVLPYRNNDPDAEKPPIAEHPFEARTQVPGSPAQADNLYHVAQGMSWLAGQCNSFQNRLKKLDDIPHLIKPLIEG